MYTLASNRLLYSSLAMVRRIVSTFKGFFIQEERNEYLSLSSFSPSAETLVVDYVDEIRVYSHEIHK